MSQRLTSALCIRRTVAAITVGAIALLLVWTAPAAFAQDEDESAAKDWTGSETYKTHDSEAWQVKFWTGAEYQGETDLDTGGDFDYWMVSGAADASRMVGEKLKIALRTDYRSVGYDFSSAIPGADPWETVHVFRLNPLMAYMLNKNWSVLGGPILEFSGEGQAKFKDSLRGGGVFGFGYRTGGLFIAGGVLALSEIEEDLRIQPIILATWTPTDGLFVGAKADTSRGGEIRLEYLFADRISFGAGIGFRRERFRLNGDDGLGGGVAPAGFNREDGVGQEQAWIGKLIVGYHVNERFVIEGYGGVTADGEFKLEDENGNRLAKSDYDDSGFGGINLRFKF